jgi:hypothetical protein
MIAGSSHSRSLSNQIPRPAQIMSSMTSIFFIVRDFGICSCPAADSPLQHPAQDIAR